MLNPFTEFEMLSPVVQQALVDGYTNKFDFEEGALVYCDPFGSVYAIPACTVQPIPCTYTELVIYRVVTPDDVKGIAILPFTLNED